MPHRSMHAYRRFGALGAALQVLEELVLGGKPLAAHAARVRHRRVRHLTCELSRTQERSMAVEHVEHDGYEARARGADPGEQRRSGTGLRARCILCAERGRDGG